MHKESFTTGSIPKAMLGFIGPHILGMILQNLYGAVDLFVVGHYAATADISAVTIGSQLMNMVTQLVIGFATGLTVLIGRYYGAKEQRELTRSAGSAIVLFAGIGAGLTGLFLGCYKPIVRLMQTPAEAVAATEAYLFVCAIGIIFIVAYNMISSMLMGMGDSKTPFLFISIACVINIVFDVVFVKYMHLGALGAAIATTMAQAGSVVFSLLFLRKKGLGFSLSRKDIRLHKSFAKKILSIGGPVAMQNVLVGGSFLFITAIINQMGLIASAAVGVVEKLINFLLMPAIACGNGVAAISAQNLGAGRPDRARATMWMGIGMALIPSVLIVVFCQFRGDWLAGIFAEDAEVIAIATIYLKSYVLDCLVTSFVFSMNGFFNSSGRAWFTMLHSIATTFALRVPLSFVFSRMAHVSFYTIGWAAPISTAASLLLCLFFLQRMRKQKAA